jgi:hypothetical protein
MSLFPRSVYPVNHVDEVDGNRQIVKYMPLWKLDYLIRSASLYFRRIDRFEDTFEGTIPLAAWDLECEPIREWYNACKEEVFICCWNLDENESPSMWRDYAGSCGIRIQSTVQALVSELSNPPVPPPLPYPDAIVEMARRSGARLAEVDADPQDGFTVGPVRYIDFDRIDVHQVLGEGPSNTVPAFRKRGGYVAEHEFRSILRPGSASGIEAQGRGADHVDVRVRLQNLIQEVRYAPANYPEVRQHIESLLARHGLDVSVVPSTIGYCPHGLPEWHIAVAAYYIWDKEGRPDGRDRDHWELAIKQLLLARSRSPAS